jgi:capsule assembly protein Wzi
VTRAELGFAIVALSAVLGQRAADGSPSVPIDDPVYLELARLRALGELPPYLGGIRPVTEERLRQLLEPDRPALGGWWLRPLSRVLLAISASSGEPRPYSTTARPRDVAGSIAIACERAYERSCERGVALDAELDAAAGYGSWLSATLRGRATASAVAIDRAVLVAELSVIEIALGRDVFVLGPGARTQLMWSSHAPPVDGVRIQSSGPLALAGDWLRGSALYAVIKPRAPQTSDNLVSVARLQLDVLGTVELGAAQILQQAEPSSPRDVAQFVLEHIRRRDASASPSDSSNRRVSLDAAVSLRGARIYYELAFEDLRRELWSAIRYDADHLLGIECAALGADGRYGLTVELELTGVRSGEHAIRTTGLTSEGRVFGSPLGPAASSVFVGGWGQRGALRVQPWLEVASLSSDTYVFPPDAGISRSQRGPSERRARVGVALALQLRGDLRAEGEVSGEWIAGRAFDPGAREQSAALVTRLVYYPR